MIRNIVRKNRTITEVEINGRTHTLQSPGECTFQEVLNALQIMHTDTHADMLELEKAQTPPCSSETEEKTEKDADVDQH